MVRFFSANQFYNFVLIPVIGALLVLSVFLFSEGVDELCVINTESSLIHLFFDNLTIPARLGYVINYLLTLVIGFQLLQINARFTFVKERTFLPAYIYVFLVWAMPGLRMIQPVSVAVVFVLLAINRIFSSLSQPKAIANAFDASFLLALASMFYLHAIVLVLFVPVCVYLLRAKSIWNEWVASFIGAILPWLFVFPVLLVLKGNEWGAYLLEQGLLLKRNYMPVNPFVITFLSFNLLMILVSSVFMLRQYRALKISSRRYNKSLFFFFVFCAAIIAFPPVSVEIIALAALPLSYLFTNFLISAKRRKAANIIFGIMMLFAFVLQYLMR